MVSVGLVVCSVSVTTPFQHDPLLKFLAIGSCEVKSLQMRFAILVRSDFDIYSIQML